MTADYCHQLRQQGYIADASLAQTLALADLLERPLLLEGDAGVGKTALAAALAKMHQSPLHRLQCYEGIEVHQALFEWNTAAQLLMLRIMESQDLQGDLTDLYQERFLLERPLLAALRTPERSVLLIDEIDRADEAFEAFLLELLAEFQVSIPELGTLSAHCRPRVILTSNATRELSDALRRRCLYFYLDYPSQQHEMDILIQSLPGLDETLARQCTLLLHGLRAQPLRKSPGVAESIDFARAMAATGLPELPKQDLDAIRNLLPTVLKTRDDLAMLNDARLADLVSAARRHEQPN